MVVMSPDPVLLCPVAPWGCVCSIRVYFTKILETESRYLVPNR